MNQTKLLILLAAISLSSCTINNNGLVVTLSNGKEVRCSGLRMSNCGSTFTKCNDGQTYECQTNYSLRAEDGK